MNSWHWPRRIAVLLASAVAMAACGGGGGGVDTGGTGAPLSFTRGPISGFGSVIVNAVRFDDSDATIVDDDGNRLRSEDLGLGMTAEIDAGGITAGTAGGNGSAKASQIRIGSEIAGPVQAIDAAGGALTVLGQTVRIDTATVFDDRLPARLASLAVGGVVEVYALPDGTSGRYLATRIQPKAGAAEYRLRGVVAALDTANKRFAIGTITVSYAGLASAPAGLADGRLVALRLSTTPGAGGVWTVLRFGDGVRAPSDRDEAKLQGIVTAAPSATRFFVDGVEVDASRADFEDGPVALGMRVEVEGALVAGVLVAAKVEIEDEDESGEFELIGSIASIDKTAQTFVLRGITVHYDAGVRYDDGTIDDLGAGVEVEVRGTLGSGGTELVAHRIKFE